MIESLEPRALLSWGGYAAMRQADIHPANVEAALTIPPMTQPTPPTISAPQKTPTPPVAGNLIYADEFNSLQWDTRYVETLWGLHGYSDEDEYYARSHATVGNGVLHLAATKTPQGGWNYTSGQISSGGNWNDGGHDQPGFAFKYGYIEASMKLTKGNLWPAFWLIGTGTQDQEIDIMEYIGEPGKWHATLHNGPQQGKTINSGLDLTAGFHRYGIHWQANRIDWYFDGAKVFTVTANIPQAPHFFILNLAVGTDESWPGAPTASTPFPNTFYVDYVKVWQ